jgi:hypothetical protein
MSSRESKVSGTQEAGRASVQTPIEVASGGLNTFQDHSRMSSALMVELLNGNLRSKKANTACRIGNYGLRALEGAAEERN